MAEAEHAKVFSVPADQDWFVAVLREIDELELETIKASRSFVANTNLCLNAIGGGDALHQLRERLVRRREAAVKSSS